MCSPSSTPLRTMHLSPCTHPDPLSTLATCPNHPVCPRHPINTSLCCYPHCVPPPVYAPFTAYIPSSPPTATVLQPLSLVRPPSSPVTLRLTPMPTHFNCIITLFRQPLCSPEMSHLTTVNEALATFIIITPAIIVHCHYQCPWHLIINVHQHSPPSLSTPNHCHHNPPYQATQCFHQYVKCACDLLIQAPPPQSFFWSMRECKSSSYIIRTYHMHLSYHMLFHQYIVYTRVLVYCSLVSSPKYTKFLTCLILLEYWKLQLPSNKYLLMHCDLKCFISYLFLFIYDIQTFITSFYLASCLPHGSFPFSYLLLQNIYNLVLFTVFNKKSSSPIVHHLI